MPSVPEAPEFGSFSHHVFRYNVQRRQNLRKETYSTRKLHFFAQLHNFNMAHIDCFYKVPAVV